MESRAILYHSNKEIECEKFIKTSDYLIISNNSKDDIWLGTGMYFWDNQGNAKWWNKKQKNRNPNEKYMIVAANAVIDRVLDLTDYEVYNQMEQIWKALCKRAKLDPEKPLGNKLNYMFRVLDLDQQYDVIKVYGKYNGTPNDGFFSFDVKSMKSEPTIAVKCIYSVKNSKCIIEKEWYKEGKS